MKTSCSSKLSHFIRSVNQVQLRANDCPGYAIFAAIFAICKESTGKLGSTGSRSSIIESIEISRSLLRVKLHLCKLIPWQVILSVLSLALICQLTSYKQSEIRSTVSTQTSQLYARLPGNQSPLFSYSPLYPANLFCPRQQERVMLI